MQRIEIRRVEDLGLAVSEARRALGMTQLQLAEQSGIERTYLAKLEAGLSTLLLVLNVLVHDRNRVEPLGQALHALVGVGSQGDYSAGGANRGPIEGCVRYARHQRLRA